jgi:putative membrane protein (TIGR04086 family)
MTVSYDEKIKQAHNENMSMKILFKGIMVSFLFTIPIFALFAVILTYTSFPQKLINPVVIVTTIVSIFAAGFIATGRLKQKGWLNGGLTGFVYMLVLYFLSSIMFNDFSIDRYVITMAVIGILTGAIGGILGCGTRSKGYKKVRHNIKHKYK